MNLLVVYLLLFSAISRWCHIDLKPWWVCLSHPASQWFCLLDGVAQLAALIYWCNIVNTEEIHNITNKDAWWEEIPWCMLLTRLVYINFIWLSSCWLSIRSVQMVVLIRSWRYLFVNSFPADLDSVETPFIIVSESLLWWIISLDGDGELFYEVLELYERYGQVFKVRD